MNVITLKNGVQIKLAKVITNTSGFHNVTNSPSWTNDEFAPFIAEATWPSEEYRLQHKYHASSSWQLKGFADPREAAYVVAMFQNDPAGTEELIQRNDIVYPLDLYDIELQFDIGAMKVEHARKVQARKAEKSKKLKGREHIYNNVGLQRLKELSKSFGQKDVSNDIGKLTVGEFLEKYHIA